MRKIKWIDGGKYNLENSKKFIEFMQMKHPFCEEVNNKEYMKGVRYTYTELYGVDEKLIDISSEDAFVKSFEALGMVEIIN
tara:strand:+ start:429 stop:671 length:243 start_codon:yes stop_codon:yes gene_type:complete